MWWRVVLLVVAYLIMGAHFLRFGSHIVAVMVAAAPLLLLLKHNYSVLALQFGLVIGTFFLWAPTTYDLVYLRLITGQPWVRLVVILTTVMLLNLVIAYLIEALKPHVNTV